MNGQSKEERVLLQGANWKELRFFQKLEALVPSDTIAPLEVSILLFYPQPSHKKNILQNDFLRRNIRTGTD